MKYKVTVTDTVEYWYTVEADSPDDAEDQALEKHTLGASGPVEAAYYGVTDRTLDAEEDTP